MELNVHILAQLLIWNATNPVARFWLRWTFCTECKYFAWVLLNRFVLMLDAILFSCRFTCFAFLSSFLSVPPLGYMVDLGAMGIRLLLTGAFSPYNRKLLTLLATRFCTSWLLKHSVFYCFCSLYPTEYQCCIVPGFPLDWGCQQVHCRPHHSYLHQLHCHSFPVV